MFVLLLQLGAGGMLLFNILCIDLGILLRGYKYISRQNHNTCKYFIVPTVYKQNTNIVLLTDYQQNTKRAPSEYQQSISISGAPLVGPAGAPLLLVSCWYSVVIILLFCCYSVSSLLIFIYIYIYNILVYVLFLCMYIYIYIYTYRTRLIGRIR